LTINELGKNKEKRKKLRSEKQQTNLNVTVSLSNGPSKGDIQFSNGGQCRTAQKRGAEKSAPVCMSK